MLNKKILQFYKQTSSYTDLGLYKERVLKFSDDIKELCILQRRQIIHPAKLKYGNIRVEINEFYGDVSSIPIYRMNYEDDIFPTGMSMLGELLRKDPEYSLNRLPNDKIHVTCRGQAILLSSILKTKNIPSRVRSGFVGYITEDGVNYDHWLVEYYNQTQQKWVLVDPDFSANDEYIQKLQTLDLPRDKFISAAEAWLGLRNKKYNEKDIYYASKDGTVGKLAAMRAIFYDFHCLMNDEIIFLHLPKYIVDKNFKLNEKELKELDNLAELMLEPDKNFELLKKIWKENIKFRLMTGALN